MAGSSGEPSATQKTSTSSLVFDDIASADIDDDGLFAPDELATARIPDCGCCSAASSWPRDHARSITDVMQERAKLFVLAPP